MMFYTGVANHDGVIEIMRHKTRQIHVGSLAIGGDAPIVVQSMTTTYTRDVDSTVAQIYRLEEVGCEIVRVAIYRWSLISIINIPWRLKRSARASIAYVSTLVTSSMAANRLNRLWQPVKSVALPCGLASTPAQSTRSTSVGRCSVSRSGCVTMVS